jgi:hypothetical protein
MSYDRHDIQTLRELAERYAEVAARPVQEERRELWRRHNSLQRTRTPVIVTFGIWNAWCEDVFGDQMMACSDPFFREHERNLRMALFHDAIGDDFILEPWITQGATVVTHPKGHWGVKGGDIESTLHDHVWSFCKPIKEWADMARLVKPHHVIDEENTARNVARLQDAVGDILEVNVDRGPAFQSFRGDLSTDVALLRGHDQLMLDMYDAPQQLHALVAFLRDGVLGVHEEAERAGDWSLTSQQNQCLCYCQELESPRANSGPRRREELWYYCAAQEFTLVSPTMHDEFLLRYQIPIVEQFGLVAYGCCENLTNKIDMLRQIPNLRIIAVTPSADLAACAEQIGTDFVISWRPSPTDMVCAGLDEDRVRCVIREGLEVTQGCFVHIHLKDVETVEGDPRRLARWAQIVHETIDRYG